MKRIATILLACFLASPAFAFDFGGASVNGSITGVDKYVFRGVNISDNHQAIGELKTSYKASDVLLEGFGYARGEWSHPDANADFKEYRIGGSVGYEVSGFTIKAGDVFYILDTDNRNEVFVSADGDWMFGGFNTTAYYDTGKDFSEGVWVDASVTGTYIADLTLGASYSTAEDNISRYFGEVGMDFTAKSLTMRPFLRYETDRNFDRDYYVIGGRFSF